ncbi:asparagine N-glycosylation enzyme membrane subunit Stt3 [Streptacidiphilus sp. MAP12-33]|uniref:hypothetical protein n=1 Tax=Streptacidiphilus sp. MAP12-33 TaxID=3156266 RepID=UPI003517082A
MSRTDRRAVVGVALLALVPYGLMLVVHDPEVMAVLAAFVRVLPIVAEVAMTRRAGTGVPALGLASVGGLLSFGIPMPVVSFSPWSVVAGGAVLSALWAVRRGWGRRTAERRAVGSWRAAPPVAQVATRGLWSRRPVAPQSVVNHS